MSERIKFWEEWLAKDCIEKPKHLVKIVKFLQETFRLYDRKEFRERFKHEVVEEMKANMLNTYFEDLAEILGEKNG